VNLTNFKDESSLQAFAYWGIHANVGFFPETKMEDKNPGSLKGQLLIAMPGLADPNFFQTVSLICEYNSEGAVGIVINRIHSHLTGEDIFNELEIEHQPDQKSVPIHIGGPVHSNEIFMIHGPPFDWESCLMVTPSLAMSSTRDVIEAIAMDRGPDAYIISLGCAGWGPGQLESEIKENAWLTTPVLDEIVFDLPIDGRWGASVKKLGIDPALLSATAGNA
jgi:putative transcriptional regulator